MSLLLLLLLLLLLMLLLPLLLLLLFPCLIFVAGKTGNFQGQYPWSTREHAGANEHAGALAQG